MKDSNADRALRRTLASGNQEAPGACPDDNELAAYMEMRLSPGETARLEKHASRCKDCQPILALSLTLAEPETATAAQAAREVPRLSPRARLLRFAITFLGVPLLRLAIAVLAVFGASLFLFRLARDWQPPQTATQAERQESGSDLSGGETSSLRASGNSRAGGGAATLPGNETPPKTASVQSELRAARPPAEPAPPPKSLLVAAGPPPGPDAKSTVPLQVDNKAEVTRPAVSEAREELLKSQRARTDLQALQMRVTAARLAEARPQAAATGNRNPAAAVAVGGIEAPKAKDAKSDTSSGGDRARQALSKARLVLGKGDPADTRTMGGRVFCLTPDYWVDIECTRHEEARVVEIARGSKEYAALLTRDPTLEGLPADTSILLYLNGVMALIR